MAEAQHTSESPAGPAVAHALAVVLAVDSAAVWQLARAQGQVPQLLRKLAELQQAGGAETEPRGGPSHSLRPPVPPPSKRARRDMEAPGAVSHAALDVLSEELLGLCLQFLVGSLADFRAVSNACKRLFFAARYPLAHHTLVCYTKGPAVLPRVCASLRGLQVLDVTTTERDLTPVGLLTRLERLDLHFVDADESEEGTTVISLDLRPLSALTSLSALTIDGQDGLLEIDDSVRSLCALSGLRELAFEHSDISDASLAQLTATAARAAPVHSSRGL
jgi:hypothetical protein